MQRLSQAFNYIKGLGQKMMEGLLAFFGLSINNVKVVGGGVINMNLKTHIAEAKNTHMTHIEDMVIDGGVDGARSAIFALRDLRDMLAGNTSDS